MRISFVQLVTLMTMLTFTQGGSAQVQKWVDADGRTHYGSKAPSNAKTEIVNNAPISSSLGISRLSDSKRSISPSVTTESRGMSEPKFNKTASGNLDTVKLYTTS